MIVGIGGSAGALEALDEFFAKVPQKTGLAFVVVQHVDPGRPGGLYDTLSRRARIPVRQVVNGTPPRPDRVYVMPPNAALTLEEGVLRLTRPASGVDAPVDAFFRSLAAHARDAAAAVVLSGAGSDGTAGLRAVKEQGGFTLAQTPESARQDGMPLNAVAAGVVDVVLAPGDMPARLVAHARYLAGPERDRDDAIDTQVVANLAAICAVLERRTGHDFARYKEGTLRRRIRRRVLLNRAPSVADYVARLEQDPAEPEALVKDLLVGVTQFFREPEAFAFLAREVLPVIFEARPPDVPVRIWVPGCASGEEAYTVAMLVREHLAAQDSGRPVQIFATDIDTQLLAEARQGRYPEAIAAHLSPERLERFFARDAWGYQAADGLREMCVFSAHNLIRDPPFSSLDLISCRNVLIYLGAELQRKLVPLFHYALRPGGHLFLGPSEGLAAHPGLFETLDKKHRVFRRREQVTRPAIDFPLSARGGTPVPAASAASSIQTVTPPQVVSAAFERMILDEYAPPCAVVNERGDVLVQAGRTGRYLQAPAGALTSNLLDMAPGPLRVELRSALASAARSGRKVVGNDVRVEVDDVPVRLRLTVRPLPGALPGSGLFVVVLQERAGQPDEREPAGAEPDPSAVERLEDELRATRADLKSAVEELEATNEELKSSNEEVISTNEELQSANEELQTSKEELQSVNEELETVNAELRLRVHELATANGDLQNLFASTDIATIFLDLELRVTRFTPAATALFHLIGGDVGRPIADLAVGRFEGSDLVEEARRVLRRLEPIELHVRSEEGARWFVKRLLPYRAADGSIAGVVITFVDVTQLKRTEQELREAREHAESLARFPEENPHPVLRIGGDGGVAYANAPALSVLSSLGLEIGRPAPEPLANAARRALVEGFWLATEIGIGDRIFLMTFVPVSSEVNVYGTDITLRKRAEEALRRSEHRFRTLTENSPDFVARYDRDLRYRYANPTFTRALGVRIDDVVGKRWGEIGLPSDAETADWEQHLREVIESGRPRRLEIASSQTGVQRWYDVSLVPESHPGSSVESVLATSRDITDRKGAEQQVERSREALRRLLDTSIQVVGEKAIDRLLQLVSDAALELTNARIATIGHGFVNGSFRVSSSSRVVGASECPPGGQFVMERGGVYLDLVEGREAIRLTDAEMRAHARWWGLPEAHVALRGILGVRLDDADGRISGMLLVTDRREGDFTAEDESLLRQLGAIASLALQHVQARIGLEEADRRKDDFLAMLSHELRNPLAPVRNSLYLLERAAPGSDQARRAHVVINRQVAHMTRLLDDLLDVTRISRGKIQLRREEVDLCEILRRAVEDHRAVFASNGVGLEISIPDSPLPVNGDATRLTQVVGNLLQNAAKFTGRDGRAAVEVATDARGAVAIVTVRDTGVGISPEMLPRLFEPFAQAESTLDRSRGGLGLGLTLVKTVVELHGGSVAARSDGAGAGAEFTFSVPLVTPRGGAEDPPVAPVPGKGRRVLVVEDNLDAAETLRDVLDLGAHEVALAGDGPTALEKAREFRPEVVLCDIGLPGMDGYEVARAFRSDPVLRSTHLVALTGYAMPEDRERAREAGFDEHLTKPAGADRIESILARAPPRPAPKGAREDPR